MYVPFENLPPESKVWIYQSNRKFTEEEWLAIETDLKAFIDSWSAWNWFGSFLFVEILPFYYPSSQSRSANGNWLLY